MQTKKIVMMAMAMALALLLACAMPTVSAQASAEQGADMTMAMEPTQAAQQKEGSIDMPALVETEASAAAEADEGDFDENFLESGSDVDHEGDLDSEMDSEADSDMDADADSEADADADADADSDADAEGDSFMELDSELDADIDSDSDSDADADADADSDAEGESESDAEGESESDSSADADAGADMLLESEATSSQEPTEPLVLAPTAAAAAGCGPYATAASVSQVGNGDKSYSLLAVAKEHLVKPADFGKVHIGKETACAFARMFDAAKKEGRSIKIRAGFRSLPAQKADLECYESLRCTYPVPQPGISIFGDGTALNLDVADMQTYQAAPSYEWIKKNGAKFGFAPAGGSPEKWIWRFNKGAAQAEPKVRASADESEQAAAVEDIRVSAPGFNPPNRGAPDRTQGAPKVGPRVYPKRPTPTFDPPGRGAPERTWGSPSSGPRVNPNKRPTFDPPGRGAPSRTN